VLRPLLARLEDRDRTVLRLRFVEGLTQREVGEEIGVTQMQVSRILSRIFATLRDEVGEVPEIARAS
jgi:RNA polymerase sigma-B factor